MRRITILAACLALAGCGGGSEDDGASATPPPGNTVTIDMKDSQFAPKDAAVRVGQTVHWVNQDTVQHDAVQKGGGFKSKLFGKGESFDWKATAAGTVEYECTIHPGMEGTLNVTQ